MIAAHVTMPRQRLPGAEAGLRELPEEMPIAMVFDGSSQAVMMATPRDLEDFARGFALSEGIVQSGAEVEGFEIVELAEGMELRHWLAPGTREALSARRRAMAGPVGCGLCGIDSLAEAMRPLPEVAARTRLTMREVLAATDQLSALQPLHDSTHAVHAAGFLVPGQGVVLVREDVGRHNALDKLIGALSRQGIDPASGALVMTSRVSMELVQKCALAGCGLLIAVSAPTALAVRLADQAGITLVALARRGGAEIFTHAARLITEPLA